VSVRVSYSEFSGSIIDGSELSNAAGFTDRPYAEQVKILREEMWEWATGRSSFRPLQYGIANGPLPAVHEYRQSQIVAKAIQIEILLKLIDAEAQQP
jgi:hypothetical protein